jgi:hypothetical protein
MIAVCSRRLYTSTVNESRSSIRTQITADLDLLNCNDDNENNHVLATEHIEIFSTVLSNVEETRLFQ